MIRIIRGVYGYLDKDGIVRPKTEADAPFSLTPEQEERLVHLGVAQYVGNVKSTPAPAEWDEVVRDIELEEDLEEIRPLTEYSVKELRELGKDYGITFKVGISKAEMVKAIKDAEAEMAMEEEEADEPAPTFDASEAVL